MRYCLTQHVLANSSTSQFVDVFQTLDTSWDLFFSSIHTEAAAAWPQRLRLDPNHNSPLLLAACLSMPGIGPVHGYWLKKVAGSKAFHQPGL